MSGSLEVWMRDDDGSLWKAASTLISKYPERLGHIDPDSILFLRVVGCKASWLGKVWRVKPPYTMLGQGHDFILAINDDRCRGIFISPIMEVMVLLHELQHIGHAGKVERHDVEDFAWHLEEFGVRWQFEGRLDKIQEVIQLFERPGEPGIEEPPEGVE